MRVLQLTRRSKTIILASVLSLAMVITPFALAPTHSLSVPSILGWTSVFNKSHPPIPIGSGITGNISISNIAPLCKATGSVADANDNTTVVVTSEIGQQTIVPVTWKIIDGCELFGTFQAGLSPGVYSLTLSYCLSNPEGQYQPPGCQHAACGLQSCNLPITVVVEPGKLTPVHVGITTGIY